MEETPVLLKRNLARSPTVDPWNVIGTAEHAVHHRALLAAHVDKMGRNKQRFGHGVVDATRAQNKVTDSTIYYGGQTKTNGGKA
jgi:hypothetical protein